MEAGEVLVLGAGGSAASVLRALGEDPPRRVWLLSRREEAGAALAERMRRLIAAPLQLAPLGDLPRLLPTATILFNTTPLGMSPADPSPVPADLLRGGLLVYDMVYRRDGRTLLQLQALAAGAEVTDGVAHVLAQGLPSFQLLTGLEAPEAAMAAAVSQEIGRAPLRWGPGEA